MIKVKIRDFVAANFLFSDHFPFEDDSSFVQHGILDSMGVMELVDFLEKEFHFKIDYNDIVPANFDSVNNIISFLRKKIIIDIAS